MRMLIVEDDARLFKSLVHTFEMNHYALDGVDNGNDELVYDGHTQTRSAAITGSRSEPNTCALRAQKFFRNFQKSR